MKLDLAKPFARAKFAMVKRGMLVALVCVVTLAGWQGAFFSNPAALAAPQLTLASVGDRVEKAADDVRSGSKELIRDTKAKVEKAASDNAGKVAQADRGGTYTKRKAQRDRNRIEQRAEDHAARTEKAVDRSMNAVKKAVDKVEDAID